MQIHSIELINFRNHRHLVLQNIGKVLIIVGNNAVGKTNIIEALQLLSMHESFRRPKNEELVYSTRPEGEGTSISLNLTLHDTLHSKQITFIENSRIFSFNKKERAAKDISDVIPSILFTPDDLQIIKGSPEQRRDMLDSLGARLSKSFSFIKDEYTKALRHKNSLLKQEKVDSAVLDSWNINLAKLGASLSKHRAGLFEQLLKGAASFYKKISGGEELTGVYCTLWDKQRTTDEYLRLFEEKKDEEIAVGRSLIGPHKDDVYFAIDGQSARRFASQGQQRSLALALKIAEIEILRRVSGKEPLLLLDDVMSELDTTRRNFFIEQIEQSMQTVFTTTHLGYFNEEFLSRATIVVLPDDAGEQE